MRNMGGESEAAWRGLLDDLIGRGLTAPSFVIIDGAAGLEKGRGGEGWSKRCWELRADDVVDDNDMIYAGTPKEIETRRKSFIRKWRLKCRAVPTAWRKP